MASPLSLTSNPIQAGFGLPTKLYSSRISGVRQRVRFDSTTGSGYRQTLKKRMFPIKETRARGERVRFKLIKKSSSAHKYAHFVQ